jgi:hypothetical protein
MRQKLQEMEQARSPQLTELEQAQADRDVILAMSQITEKDVESLLGTAIKQMEELDRAGLKHFLRGMVTRSSSTRRA